jgi:hypothetical protein
MCKWISVRDAFPGDMETVLTVYRGVDGIGSMNLRFRMDGDWIDLCDCTTVIPAKNITHWMDLPDYPELTVRTITEANVEDAYENYRL